MDEEQDDVILSLELDPEHYGILAAYGDTVRKGLKQPKYSERHLSNFIGMDVGHKLDTLEQTGHIEKHFWEEKDEYFFRLHDDEFLRQDTVDLMEHVYEEYGGRVYEFIEKFDEEDERKLAEYGLDTV